MNEELKQVWIASAVVETLQGEMDQAQTSLDSAIGDAMRAGATTGAVSGAANLTAAELDLRVQPVPGEELDPPVQPASLETS